VRTVTRLCLTGTALLAAAVLLAVAAAAGAFAAAAPPKTFVVTNNTRNCTDCSLPEAQHPKTMRFGVKGLGALNLSNMTWRGWGHSRTTAHAKGGVETNGIDPGRAVITLNRRVSHLRDGCGHTADQFIYTRARIRLSGFRLPSQNRVVVLSFPRTGCETY